MSAFTPREVADALFTSAASTGTKSVMGASAEQMHEIVSHRLAHIDDAIRAIDKAVGSPRVLLREPDDQRLAQMKAILTERRERIAQVLEGAK